MKAGKIENYSIVQMPDGRPAQLIKPCYLRYINIDGDWEIIKIKHSDQFEVLISPSEAIVEMLYRMYNNQFVKR